MHMTSGLLPDWLLILCDVLAGIALLVALWRVNWKFISSMATGHQIGVVFILICGLYAIDVGVKPGMTIHWLGVMMTVMMFGPWVAILLLSAVHILFAFALNIGGIDTIGFNITVSALVPIIIAYSIHTFSYYKWPHIVPIYIAQVGAGDLLCMLSVDAIMTTLLYTFFDYPGFTIREYSFLLGLMGGMEALISTWVAALLICYLPGWLVTFNDEEYIHGK
jgi:uncharacterized membrane protein